MKIIIAILIFYFIIIFHELGHFLLAKKNHIQVNEFQLGFGPTLLHFEKGGTRYSFKLIPMGGACVMEGEEDGFDNPLAFNNASVWARFTTILAGPFFNFLLAFIMSVVLVAMTGYDSTVIGSVTEGYPAEEAGIQAGDEIVNINGFHTFFFRDITNYTRKHTGEPLRITYKRDGARYKATVTPKYDSEDDRYYIGITSSGYYEKASVLDAIKYGLGEVRYWIYATVDGLKMIVTGGASFNDMSGPVGVVQVVGDTYEVASSYGAFAVIASLLQIAILLSANLGVMNLLPIPALDGGRLLLLLVEAVRRKPLPREKESFVHAIGFVLLFALMIAVCFNDIRRLFTGGL